MATSTIILTLINALAVAFVSTFVIYTIKQSKTNNENKQNH